MIAFLFAYLPSVVPKQSAKIIPLRDSTIITNIIQIYLQKKMHDNDFIENAMRENNCTTVFFLFAKSINLFQIKYSEWETVKILGTYRWLR